MIPKWVMRLDNPALGCLPRPLRANLHAAWLWHRAPSMSIAGPGWLIADRSTRWGGPRSGADRPFRDCDKEFPESSDGAHDNANRRAPTARSRPRRECRWNHSIAPVDHAESRQIR